jgi:hypothetical protein
VGHYRIDIVVEGLTKRLAVECDGDRYHPLEKLQEDMARQGILERLGWRFVRIRGTAFYSDPAEAMRGVFQKLEDLGIERLGPGALSEEATSSELTERVVRRAAELRREWAQQEANGITIAAIANLARTGSWRARLRAVSDVEVDKASELILATIAKEATAEPSRDHRTNRDPGAGLERDDQKAS